MKPVQFLGDSLKCLRDFPEDARHDAGYQLLKLQKAGMRNLCEGNHDKIKN